MYELLELEKQILQIEPDYNKSPRYSRTKTQWEVYCTKLHKFIEKSEIIIEKNNIELAKTVNINKTIKGAIEFLERKRKQIIHDHTAQSSTDKLYERETRLKST